MPFALSSWLPYIIRFQNFQQQSTSHLILRCLYIPMEMYSLPSSPASLITLTNVEYDAIEMIFTILHFSRTPVDVIIMVNSKQTIVITNIAEHLDYHHRRYQYRVCVIPLTEWLSNTEETMSVWQRRDTMVTILTPHPYPAFLGILIASLPSFYILGNMLSHSHHFQSYTTWYF